MNEDRFKATVAALEHQRNSAFNALVNTEVALTLTSQEVIRLRQEVADLKAAQSHQPLELKATNEAGSAAVP